MRKNLWLTVAVLAMFSLVLTGKLAAQQCFTFSNYLASYQSVSFDGTYIYTSVEIDGGESMNISPSCARYLPTYYHTPKAYNNISGPDGTNVGGWGNGSQTCADCYLSYTNHQNALVTAGTSYTLNWQTQAVCTGGGTFYGATGWIGAKISLATYLNTNQPPIGGYYQYNLACPNGTVPTCPSSIYTTSQNYKWAEEGDVQIIPGGSQPYCLGANAIALFNGPPAPFNCR